VRYFDIEGQATGVKSKAMTSPCGKIRIPINEEGNEKAGQIQEVPGPLPRRRHPAHRDGLDQSLRHGGCAADERREAAATSETYYELLDQAHPGHGENIGDCSSATSWWTASRANCCCRSSARTSWARSSSSSSSARATKGFGEGNFKALFETMELDQMRRGVLASGDK
jgi:4-hydroxyphenylpyruvate dioxygenase